MDLPMGSPQVIPDLSPLLPVAKQILDRYKDTPDCVRKGGLLPVLSNQKINAYLKEVADP